MLNKQGQNIVHVAAKNGKDNVIKYVLKTPELEKFINERDEKGNTPLHLATMHWRPKIVNSLTWDKRVRLELVNDAGLTALDVAEKYIGTAPPFQKRLTWMALKSAGAPRSKHQKPNRHSSRKWKPPNMENYKERINTLMLVLTIIATVTFTAGFTVPGGYKSSAPDEGTTTLLNSNYFKAFLICDTKTTYSSVIAIVTLIWAHLGDLNLVLFALRLAMPLLGLSLAMMSLAFMAGVCLVVSNLPWLDDFIQIMGMIFLSTIMALFVPLYFPDTSRLRTLRFVSYYVLSWVMFASGSYGDDDDQEEL
ncbi:Protein ACCELERATED CELL DEATH 6 [Camellia lanceoleosa]|uniref:Protein ACCELERATED CELL DEATH 6 n=1 Tax=Camellia lanceoleosa TaxID=1840588 RepID=A0ACC0H0R8_9ERIC|nr:Protein ACCELERATED CELL DEATH 6 [Camellia lanceoleosa]